MGFIGEGASNDSEIVEDGNFHLLLLAIICSETLDRIDLCRIYIHDTQPFHGFSVVPNA